MLAEWCSQEGSAGSGELERRKTGKDRGPHVLRRNDLTVFLASEHPIERVEPKDRKRGIKSGGDATFTKAPPGKLSGQDVIGSTWECRTADSAWAVVKETVEWTTFVTKTITIHADGSYSISSMQGDNQWKEDQFSPRTLRWRIISQNSIELSESGSNGDGSYVGLFSQRTLHFTGPQTADGYMNIPKSMIDFLRQTGLSYAGLDVLDNNAHFAQTCAQVR